MNLSVNPKIPVDGELLDRLSSTANRAADAAALVTQAHFRQSMAVDNKDVRGGFDPVTIADRGAEQAIRDVVLAEFPTHGFLGEETGRVDQDGQLLWVIDPIDGTRSFITGVPLWGTLIAVYDGESVVLGVMDQPHLQERLVGTVDSTVLHTRSDARAVSTSDKSLLADAILQSTSPDLFTDPFEAGVFRTVRDAVSMTRYGGDCYCYALLAMGFVDVVVESDLKPYDIQAMIPIIQGAGGIITTWDGGSPASGGRIVASANHLLHEQVMQLLQG